MQVPTHLQKLQEREQTLAEEVNRLLSALKTETGELTVHILEYLDLLDMDSRILAGNLLEMKQALEGNSQKQNKWKSKGEKLLKKVRRHSTERKHTLDATPTHSILQNQETTTFSNHHSETEA